MIFVTINTQKLSLSGHTLLTVMHLTRQYNVYLLHFDIGMS